MKKLILCISIGFILFGLMSCYSTKTLTSQQEYEDFMKNKKGEYEANEKKMAIEVVTKVNDTITFSKENPGIISETEVSGYQMFLLPFGEIDSTVFYQNTIQFIWKDGKKYEFISQNKSGYNCRLDKVNIPFQDIAQMEVRSLNGKKTAGAIVLGVAVPVSIVIIALYIDFVINGF